MKLDDNSSNKNGNINKSNPTKELEDSIFNKLKELDKLKLMNLNEDKTDEKYDENNYKLKEFKLNSKDDKDRIK